MIWDRFFPAAQHSQEMLQAHSGLNEQRVARLLGLLD